MARLNRAIIRPRARGLAALAAALVVACTPTPASPPRNGAPAPRPPATTSAAPASEAGPPPPDVITLGEVAISPFTSETSALFHAVDQMSAWSPFSHAQYAAWKPAGAEELLARQRALRAKRGFGMGLERAFYVNAMSPDAAAAMVEGALVDDAREEAAILDAMRPLLASKLGEIAREPAQGVRRARALAEALRANREELTPHVSALLALFDRAAPREPIPMAFVPSPGVGVGGGGANGGVIVIEVPESGDVSGTLTSVLHELTHALAAARRAELGETAEACGLDATTMGEAIAYAVAPGLIAYGAAQGGLERGVSRNAADTPYGRFARLALAILPDMRAALDQSAHGRRGGYREVTASVCAAAAKLSVRTRAK